MLIKTSIIATIGMFFTASVSASELLVTSSVTSYDRTPNGYVAMSEQLRHPNGYIAYSEGLRGQSMSLDFYNTDAAVSLLVSIEIPKGAKLDTNGMGQKLPYGFVALTDLVDDRLVVLIANETGELLPNGLVSLGTLSVEGGEGSFSVVNAEAVDNTAKVLNVDLVNIDASE